MLSDSEDTKTCAYRIKEASKNNSGEYGCMVSNFFKCSKAPLMLNLEGKYDNLFNSVNNNELLFFFQAGMVTNLTI